MRLDWISEIVVGASIVLGAILMRILSRWPEKLWLVFLIIVMVLFVIAKSINGWGQ